MKAGYKIQSPPPYMGAECLLITNYNERNTYEQEAWYLDEIADLNTPHAIGVWIPKNPNGTSKKRPDNWPNKSKTFDNIK